MCRESAAYEIKRLNRRIETLEGKASLVREGLLFRDPFKPDGYDETRLAFFQGEIAACEARLRELLAAGGKSPGPRGF
jgi:hypothetical protein